MKKNIGEIAKADERYDVGAIKFVYEGLGYVVKAIREQDEELQDQKRHITGRELCEGLRDLAIEKWGRLARMVL